MGLLIKSIGCYLPERRLDNIVRAAQFGLGETFVREKLGPIWLTRKETGQDTSDLAEMAVRNIDEPGFNLQRIDGLIVCTQNPDGRGLPHTSAVLHAKLGLAKNCAAFDISLGCSGFVYGLAIANSFGAGHGLRNVLLITSDPYSKIIDDSDRETALLFGDAAAATWLSADALDGSGFSVGLANFGTDGSGAQSLYVDPGGRIRMNGRSVFSFAAIEVPRQINELLNRADLTTAEVDRFVLHQGSRYILDAIQQRLKVPSAKVPLGLETQGNTVSSSIPLLLAELVKDQAVRRVVISGFGVGLSWASMILERPKP